MRRFAGVILALSCFLLSGCAELFVVGGATSAVASQDRRDVSTQVDDQKFEIQSIKKIFDNDALWDNTHISVISYNNVVLVVGQAPTATLKEHATKAIQEIAPVRKVYNQIRVAAPISFFARRHDEYITSKVKSSMLFASDFPASKVKVVTENSEVFLLGLVTQNEADKAVDISRNIDGVKRVIKVFEYVKNEKSAKL